MIPLQKLHKDPKVGAKITEEDINGLFCNLDELLSVHGELCSELLVAQDKYPAKSVGQIFLQKVHNIDHFDLLSYSSPSLRSVT
jgi:hypothetical protein